MFSKSLDPGLGSEFQGGDTVLFQYKYAATELKLTSHKENKTLMYITDRSIS